MTQEQARTLKLRDRIQWQDDPADTGEIIYVTDQCVGIKWANDGVIGVYRFERYGIKYINLIEKEAQDAFATLS